MADPTSTADPIAGPPAADDTDDDEEWLYDDVEADSDDNSDADSALGGMNSPSSTISISASLYESVHENGRTYHRYKAGQYPLPNDEPEQERLDFQHRLYKLCLDGKLYAAPIQQNPKNVLDVGTGTGAWAVEFALEHPGAYVIGTDLSPIQPERAPPNCSFEICDAEDEWTFTTPFDFIHMRAMMTCFRDPRAVFAAAYEHLAPGGYLQLRDPVFPLKYMKPPPADCALVRWNDLVLEAAARMGRPWTNAERYEAWLDELGFVDVVEMRERLPLCPWTPSNRMKELSHWLQHNLQHGLEGMTMALFTRVLGWTAEQVRAFLVHVRRDMLDITLQAYSEGVIVYGRKPRKDE